MSPLSVTGYGTVEERIDEGHEIEEHEYELIKKAKNDNSVVIAEITPLFEN